MALPTRDELKAYLRIETSVDDDLIDRLLLQAQAAVEAYIRQPIVSRPVTLDLVVSPYASRLVVPYAPIAPTGVVVEDGDGTAVDAAGYTLHEARGWIVAVTGSTFAAGTYRVTVTVGLDLRNDYSVAVEPVMSAAIIDWAADLYQRRNPAASYESGGGGVAVNYNETASKTMPSRVRVTLDPWRRVLV